MPDGCPYIAGPACQDCDGSCWMQQPTQAAPSGDEVCAAMGHPIYAEDEKGRGICYCGASATDPAGPVEVSDA